jgi:hypothetical protein
MAGLMDAPRPATVCAGLLDALDASNGRRLRRKRDQTPDTIGLALKRDLLEQAVRDDPAPDAFEGWLLERCLTPPPGASAGSVRAVAVDVLLEWRLAARNGAFSDWLARGAPSDDATPEGGPGGAPGATGASPAARTGG